MVAGVSLRFVGRSRSLHDAAKAPPRDCRNAWALTSPGPTLFAVRDATNHSRGEARNREAPEDIDRLLRWEIPGPKNLKSLAFHPRVGFRGEISNLLRRVLQHSTHGSRREVKL